ncbi:uncharacterized protein LOC133912835 isoform X1 [Phragmites australis]|uniref:uncharacterized protein LOC133912835 isoform X1 n=1 Tax=Phragmites australis TaxID=29695 RepID=UPI002D77ED7C|nr:uncharacterized protein LOC133912835 isoform X1 [Phragmites australis]
MQAVRGLVLRHLRLGCRRAPPAIAARGDYGWPNCGFARGMSAPADQDGGGGSSEGAVRARVVDLVKKFDKIDADKVSTGEPIAARPVVSEEERQRSAPAEGRAGDGPCPKWRAHMHARIEGKLIVGRIWKEELGRGGESVKSGCSSRVLGKKASRGLVRRGFRRQWRGKPPTSFLCAPGCSAWADLRLAHRIWGGGGHRRG